MLTYLEESAMLTCEHLQIGRVDKDAAVDVLQAVPAQVESLQAAQLVEYAWSEFLDLEKTQNSIPQIDHRNYSNCPP